MRSTLFTPYIRDWNISRTINFFHTGYTSQTLYITKRKKGYYCCEEYFDTFKEAYEDFTEEVLLSSHKDYNPELYSVFCTTLKGDTYK